jgi:hypothetical protein
MLHRAYPALLFISFVVLALCGLIWAFAHIPYLYSLWTGQG